MEINQGLSDVLPGRVVARTGQEAAGRLTIGFEGGSWMSIATEVGAINSVSPGGTVSGARQRGCSLRLDLQGGGSLEINTAQEQGGVAVHDAAGLVLYGG